MNRKLFTLLLVLCLCLFSAGGLYSWDKSLPDTNVNGPAIRQLIRNPKILEVKDTDCGKYPDKIAALKNIMDQKDGLYVEACEIRNEWIELGETKNCGLDSQKLDCFASKEDICSTISDSYKVSFDWVMNAIEHCDYPLFNTGCPSLNEIAKACQSMQCNQKCKNSFTDCSAQTFKSAMYSTSKVDTQKVQLCLKQQGIQ